MTPTTERFPLCHLLLLIVIAAAAALPQGVAMAQDTCFVFDPPLLFDTSWNDQSIPSNPRVHGLDSLYWNGHQLLVANTGNDLRFWRIDNPAAAMELGSTAFGVPPWGDRDYHLFNFTLCESCRYGVAGFEVRGAVFFDLGPNASPSLYTNHYYPSLGVIGAFTFEHIGQQYLVINNHPDGCYDQSMSLPTLFTFDGIDVGQQQQIQCLLSDTGDPYTVRGGYTIPGSASDDGSTYVYIVGANWNVHMYRVEGSGSGLNLVSRGAVMRAEWLHGRGIRLDLDAPPPYERLAVTASGLGTTLWDISDTDLPIELVTWNPTPLGHPNVAAIDWPLLYLGIKGTSSSFTFDISNPTTPVEIDPEFWDASNPWNSYPRSSNYDAEFSAGGGYLFLGRFSVLERFVPDDCGSLAPVAYYTIEPQPVFPGQTATLLNTTPSNTYDTSAVWISDGSGTIVVGSGVLSDGEPVSRDLELPIDLIYTQTFTAHVAVANAANPCDDPVNNPDACGDQVASGPLTVDREPHALITISPPDPMSGDTIQLDGRGSEGEPNSHRWEIAVNGQPQVPPAPFDPYTELTSLTLDDSGEWTITLSTDYVHQGPAGSMWSHTTSTDLDVTSLEANVVVVPGQPLHSQDISLCSESVYSQGINPGRIDFNWEVFLDQDMQQSFGWTADGCEASTPGCVACGVVIPAGTFPPESRQYWAFLTLVNDDPQHAGFGDRSTAWRSFEVTDAADEIDFIWSPVTPEIGTTVTFTTDLRWTPLRWEFGGVDCGGQTPTLNCTQGIDCRRVEWAYGQPGIKTVTFVAAEGSVSRDLQVADAGSCDQACYSTGVPTSGFTISPNPATVGETVSFADTSTKGRQPTPLSRSRAKALGFSWQPWSPDIGELVVFEINGVDSVDTAVWDFGGDGCSGYSRYDTCVPSYTDNCLITSHKYASAGEMEITLSINGGALTRRALTVADSGECGGGSNCVYEISPTEDTIGAAGGSATISVTTASVCDWTATSNDPSWLHITDGASSSGFGEVIYSADPNPDDPRSGTLEVAGHSVTILQEADYGSAPTSWLWTVERGGALVLTDQEQAFEHAFDTPGEYQVTLAAANCMGSDSTVQTLLVEAEPIVYDSLVIPAVVRSPGSAGTNWRSDVTIFNPGSESLEATIRFLPEAVANELDSAPWLAISLAPLETRRIEDVLAAIPGAGADPLKGTLHLSFADGDGSAPVVSSRTYNLTDDGTFGQFVPAVAPTAAKDITSLVLTGLVHNADYRSNLGLAGLNADAVDPITVTILAADGSELGSLTTDVPALSSRQLVSVSRLAGVDQDLDLFSVRISADGGALTAYASVVDNLSGDPVLYVSEPADEVAAIIPGVAHLPGAYGSLWRSDLSLLNTGQGESTVRLVYLSDDTPPAVSSMDLTLEAGSSAQYLDILGSLPGIPDTSKGYLVVEALDSAVVPTMSCRTFNETDQGTYGQGLEVFGLYDVITSSGCVTGVANSATDGVGFRSNLGLVNLNVEHTTTVEVQVLDTAGVAASETLILDLDPGQFLQIDLFGRLGIDDLDLEGTTLITVTSGGPVVAYGSVVDNSTQDPILIPAQIIG